MSNDNNKKLSEHIDDMIKFLSSANDEYHNNVNMEHELFNTRVDMIHDLELNDNLTYHQIAHLALDIKQVSKTRRKYKNGYILREPLYNFLKEHPSLISDLRQLRDELAKVEGFINNMHYNYKQKVKDINILDDDTPETENKEDLVALNRMISKFTDKYSTEIAQYSNNEQPCEISVKIWFPDCTPTSLSGLKQSTSIVKSDIERFFAKQHDNREVSFTTSDMLVPDEKDELVLNSRICVTSNGIDIYHIHFKSYGTKEVTPKKNKKNKKSKKRR